MLELLKQLICGVLTYICVLGIGIGLLSILCIGNLGQYFFIGLIVILLVNLK